MKMTFWFLLIIGSAWIPARADDFFNIEGVSFHQTASSDVPQITKYVPRVDSDNKPVLDTNGRPVMDTMTVPLLAMHVSVKDQIKTNTVTAKAYFYDPNRHLIETAAAPTPALPVIIPKDKVQTICFAVPDDVLALDNWSAVVVFGDDKGIDAQVYSSSSSVTDFDFPEKNLLEDKDGPPIERKTAMDPLIEHMIQIDNPNQPQFTLFLRPPLGMTDASQAKGVLCMSVVAGNLDGVKRQLQGFEAGDDLEGILKFAEDRKLIIICWGFRYGLWDSHKNWDDLSPDVARDMDKTFDDVANGWERGVQYFVKEYGIPSNGYLMWGISGGSQFACRLALRKPDYFLAVHVHIPSSFDKPTPEASKILWCLTTGELEPGYQRSLRFYTQCRALGYPMIYKAIEGLGHEGSPIADDIGLKFFDYALSVRGQRFAYDASLNDPLKQFQMAQSDSGNVQPWLNSFYKPAYVGDAVNQGMVPYEQEDTVPMGFRVPLPTKEIAEAWNK